MTTEQAKSELMQIYGMLSEEKKQAIDVFMAQAEVNAHAIQSALDNGTNTVIGTGGMRDATPEERESIDKYIKSISKPTGVDFWDLADGEYISRKALLEDLYKRDYTKFTHRDFVALVQYQDIVAIPPAEPKTGHWIDIDEEPHEVWECDHCGFVIDGSGCIDPYDYRDTYKFCPNCGCRMFEPQEISDHNLKMWEDIYEEEKRRTERSEE